jgi:hypothetical protein
MRLKSVSVWSQVKNRQVNYQQNDRIKEFVHHRDTEGTENLFFFDLPGDEGKSKPFCLRQI